MMLLHASSVARGRDAVLLLGPSGSGKSDLVLRLLQSGWCLVADDQVALRAEAGELRPDAPAALAGLLEVRGLGILGPFPRAIAPVLRLVARLMPRTEIPRMPEAEAWTAEGVSLPAIRLHAFDASAPARLAFALDAALGRLGAPAGAFAKGMP
ncbi:HPr kinase/phosphatase C-terminal domain-containing protein [Belnapia sp. T6]|uniref:HPr kinase/phosphatase C-terminal domain-containing protein n=1 Tax=Belnapia mucosa TaxID=2804532 RepID=A0ABS1V688_9PROT|nr:HPr kinase/phosphatase C-terminal domain-containing protein [Belnapia mucosa]MBL6457187.1 HPr kinase/phosphatase C-terminal domain-containing protein [Belnapia mucosa]